MMLQTENPEYLYLLFGLVLFTILFVHYVSWRRSKISKFFNADNFSSIAPQRSTSFVWFKFVFGVLLAGAFLIMTLANPLIGKKLQKVSREGVDIIIAMDLSNSMYAQDVKPNRLMKSKKFVFDFSERLSSDRLGLVFFAGNAYLQMPLTLDYSICKMYLDNLSPQNIPTQGTDIAEAIEVARKAFNQNENKHKVLIIITDGEDHKNQDIQAVKEAVKEGIRIYSIGVGTTQGAPIPIPNSNNNIEYKKDVLGNQVISKLNSKMIEDLANTGKGESYFLEPGKNVVNEIYSDISQLDKRKFKDTMIQEFDSQYQYFLGIAMVLLLISFFIPSSWAFWKKIKD